MEKRLALAIALCVGFMILWTWLFPTKPNPPAQGGQGTVSAPSTANRTGADGTPKEDVSPATDGSAPAGAPAPTPAPAGRDAAAPSRAAILPQAATAAGAEEEIAVTTPLASIRISNRGARVLSWKVPHYRDSKGEPLDLVSEAGRKLDALPLDLHLEDPNADRMLKQALFHVDRKEVTEGAKSTTLTLTWSDGSGNAAAKVLRIDHGSYLAELQVAAEIGGRPVAPGIQWGAGFERDQAIGTQQTGVGTRAVVDLGGRIEHQFESALKPNEPWSRSGPIAWAGVESKYFAAILMPQGGGEARVRAAAVRLVEDGRETFHLSSVLTAPGAEAFHLFVGPKDYDVLKGLNLGLERLLNFGFFGFIALPLFYALKFVQRYTGNYGWAIVVLTICIRLVFFPFMHRSQLKMRVMQEKMKRIQTKLKAMKERYHKLER
jgi:YidC/Oxa1 family membrane protein insertase